jgi:hypothetical protein
MSAGSLAASIGGRLAVAEESDGSYELRPDADRMLMA